MGTIFLASKFRLFGIKEKNSIAHQVSVKGFKELELEGARPSPKVILNLHLSCEAQLGTGRFSVVLKKACTDHIEAGNLFSAKSLQYPSQSWHSEYFS